MSFDPDLWTRLEYDGVPVWVRPDKPDWLVPNRSGDSTLRRLAGGERPGLDLHEQRFLARLPDDPRRRYTGRYPLLGTDRLRELWFHITDTCNMTCNHCLVSSSPQAGNKLPAGRIAEIAGQATDLGCRIFALTGGEPLVHPDFEPIVDGLLADGESRVVVLTNGVLLERYETALDRWPSDRFHLQVSVDGLPQNHERLRGAHSFDKLLSQLRRLESRGVPFTVSMCVMDQNRSEMPDVVEFAADVGATNVHFLWYFVRGRGAADFATLPGELFSYLRQAAGVARERGITIDNIESCRSQVFSPSGTIHDGSNSGWESVALGPDGKLYPSPALVGISSLGTPVNGDLAATWRGSGVLESLRRSTAAGQASPLRFLVGGGDSDHSFVHTGRFSGGDPFLPLHEQMVLWLIASEASSQPVDGPPALRLKMGDVLSECGDGGPIALTHSNCLLAVASRDQVRIVKEFYAEAAELPSEEIRNPVCYPKEWTAHIPEECLVRSFGCGSPVLDAEIQPGERVVDLGSGTGVECLIASKLVGRAGSVVGIDMLEPMVERARRGAAAAGAKLGYENVEFTQAYLETLPLETGSADVVLSNCVINLSHHKRRTFAEVFRALAEGGRLVVSDVVCEIEPPSTIRNDETLRGECIAGALTQRDLVGLLEEAGFRSFRVLNRFPYRVVQGHPFFSLTFRVTKPATEPAKRVMYRGPFSAVLTPDGTLFTPGSVGSASVPESLDGSGEFFELDADGRVTNVDLGESACCTRTDDAAVGHVETAPSCCGTASCSNAPTAADPRLESGCMSCGAALRYFTEERELTCELCGTRSRSTATCVNGHFVCDSCHVEDGLAIIERICLTSRETDMFALLQAIRSHDAFPLHGPEHHALVPGVILATYRNLGGELSDEKILSGIRRGATVSGGACGTMGSCGAATGVGIAFSTILGATPLEPGPRSAALMATSEVLAEIAGLNAARCCRRECLVALRKAAEISATRLPIALQAQESVDCTQVHLNDECIGVDCPFYPE